MLAERLPHAEVIHNRFHLVAGLNAARRASGQDGIVFDRAESYIGVLVDDLVTRGASEPPTTAGIYAGSIIPESQLLVTGQITGREFVERVQAFYAQETGN